MVFAGGSANFLAGKRFSSYSIYNTVCVHCSPKLGIAIVHNRLSQTKPYGVCSLGLGLKATSVSDL